MRLPRMTTRRWMVAVVSVSLLLGGIAQVHRLSRWRNHYLQLAGDYAREEQYVSRCMAPQSPPVEIMINGQRCPLDVMVKFLSARKKAYLHAASCPWLSVPPALPSMRIEIRDWLMSKEFANFANFDHMRRTEANDAWAATYGDRE